MSRAIRAEWAKTWSDPGAAWLPGGLVVLSVAVSAVAVAAARCQATGCAQDPARIDFTGVYFGQVVAALAGVLALGGEYSTGMIRVTLTAIPRRERLLAAKILVLAGPVLVASALAAGASMFAGWLVLPGHGFTDARGFDLASGAMWRAACCAALYLMLVAVLGFGITALVRDSAAAIGIVLGLLYLFPVAASLVGDPAGQRLLQQVGPLSAGMDSMVTAGLGTLPLTPWQGLGVVAVWAAGAVVLGGVMLRLRDA